MLITFYGINNIGKTTQAKRIVARLQTLGKKVEYLKYPIYDIEPTGSYINKVLRSGDKQNMAEEELQLWFLLNRFQFQAKLKEKLDAGTIIIAEDYRFTGIAWGTAKGADQDWLEKINANLIPEDLVILLDGDRQIKAKESNHLHESNDKLVDKCRQVYLNLAQKYDWEKVEISEDWDQTTEKIWEIIKKRI